MGETLFIAHRIPFPPDRGDKIRSHHLLRALAALGPVHVATLGESAGDFAAEPLLAEVATTHCLARRPLNLPLAGVRAMLVGKPVSLTAFDSPDLRRWIARTIAERPIDTIFVFSGQMGQYVPDDFAGRVIVDLCDVDSAKFEAYARERGGARGWIDAREGRLLAAEEARLAARAGATLLVSENEADLLRARVGLPEARISAVGNGIDTAYFDPDAARPHPALASEAGPHLVFTGQMDYPPNIAAAVRAARLMMPLVRDRHPQARFHVVGRAPTADVRALEGVNGTRVWGEVPDVRPFLAAADAALVPLAIARGVQNKVLEAMAMARPVVLTGEAATGIGGVEGRHYAIAGDDRGLARAVLALLADGEGARAMGSAARRFVVEEKSWEAALAPLAGLLATAGAARDAA
ncbi:TIGR03087 family PEP-CTERM/XrtA system glycosyltransferase [Tsuneonella sp. YG55]|uniref:TIGR03087 family PEP-CTERM/XrtA system glycosyltransferase n=1 Tax=Tsuneonella litorea TaxID=2976475 RepID=A0A9X2W192_9SPHN|nr:TIGR03087 family PEP-CTERM/XrtA system glycosyltransferase [Tsuneonella litorea]MCT2558748.1 TIGR03087 family PEP-CTERM/XrtA system glycosyltransferase [Tsuneonella litorea]